jgi:adenylate kinase family enzyme
LIDYYKALGLLKSVDGGGKIETITAQLIQALNSAAV